jgi:nitrite reductase/ring-hydroxylating ferredoxin subunit
VTSATGGALCPLADLAEGVPRGLTASTGEGLLEMLVMRQGGRLVAYLNRCPHRGTPLDWAPDRFLAPDGTHFQCSTHGARFRIADGYCVAGPCRGERLRAVAVRVEGGMVRLA